MINCPLCDSSAAESVLGHPSIVKCPCGLVYLGNPPSREVLEKFYQEWARSSHMRLPTKPTDITCNALRREFMLDLIAKHQRPDGILVDVGGGWGCFANAARDRGYTPFLFEICEESCRYARDILSIPAFSDEFNGLGRVNSGGHGSVNVVTMIHSFEHVPRTAKVLKAIFSCLAPGGLFAGIVPNYDSFCSRALGLDWPWLDPNFHYVHFTPSTLSAACKNAGFELVELYTQAGDCPQAEIDAVRSHHPDVEGYGDPDKGEEIVFVFRKPTMSQFEHDWFSPIRPTMEEHVSREATTILEIGSFEGLSTTWFLDWCPKAAITCIDHLQGGEDMVGLVNTNGLLRRFSSNVPDAQANRITFFKQPSDEAMRWQPSSGFDVVFVDGSHVAKDVLSDLVGAYRCVKVGGIIIADDYSWHMNGRNDCPKVAIDAFIACHLATIQPIYCGRVVILKRVS